VPKDSFNPFVSEIKSVLDLNFDMNDKALDFFVELIVGPFNQRNDKVDDLSPFLCLNSFMVIKLFFMFKGRVKHRQRNLDKLNSLTINKNLRNQRTAHRP
jgi:hypothetical protein